MAIEINIEKLIEIYSNEQTIASAARKYCEENGLVYNDSVRRRFSNIINQYTVGNDTDTKSNQYDNDIEAPKILSAIGPDGKLMNIEKYCEFYGLDFDRVRSYKFISHTGKPFFNIVFKSEEEKVVQDISKDIDFLKSLIDSITPLNSNPDIPKYFSTEVDRLIITDVHINMDNNGDVNTSSTFKESPYTEEEIYVRLKKTVESVYLHKKSDHLIIDNLGDFMDGLQGQTSRGGHSLPQMYSDKKAFEIGFNFQVKLIEGLLPYYETIILNNLTNDNHGFLLGYFVHSAVKRYIENKYPNKVRYNIIEEFFYNYKVGNHTFILTHGKDSTEMKFGMKLNLDATTIQKIDQYCKQNQLYDGNRIELSKGDLHSFVQDYTSSNDFEYVNYPAFSPASNWVKTNFGVQKSGVVFQTLYNDTKSTTPIWF